MRGLVQGGSTYFDGVKIGTLHTRMLWLCAVCYMFDQMDTSTFAYAAPVLVKTWGVTMEQIAQVNSYNFVGMFIGAVCGGWLADKIGRKVTLILSIAIFSFASIAGGLATNYAFLGFTRFVTGVGLIAMVVIAMVYISEMTPSDRRGKFVSLTIACGTIGIPLGAAFARWVVPLSAESWRYIFILGGGTILLIPLCISWFKESPRWLVSKGRIAEAEQIIKELTGRAVNLSSEAVEKAKPSNNLEALKVMFSREYLKRTLTLLLITNGVVLGAHLLSGFYPAMLQEYAGFQLTLVLSIMAISWWGIPFGDLSASLVSDRGGRKIPLAVYSIINGLAYIICGLIAIPTVIIGALFISRVFGGGSASMLYTYLAESYPTHIRSNAVGLIMGSSRVIAAIAVFIVPPILATYGWLGIHLLNAAIIIIPALMVLIWGEKTSRRTLEDINRIAQQRCI